MRRSITVRSSSSSCSSDAVIRTASRSWSSKAVVAARIAFDAVSVIVTSEARTIRRSLAKTRGDQSRRSRLIFRSPKIGPAVQRPTARARPARKRIGGSLYVFMAVLVVDEAIPETTYGFEDRWLPWSRFAELAPQVLDVLANPHRANHVLVVTDHRGDLRRGDDARACASRYLTRANSRGARRTALPDTCTWCACTSSSIDPN